LGWPQWTSGSGRGYAGAEFGGVTGYASSAGFGVIFTGGKPCKTEKNSNPRADLCSAARKLIRSSKVVTPAWCDVDIKLGKQAKISPNILSSSSPYKENTSH
jgi:hypothetical protein